MLLLYLLALLVISIMTCYHYRNKVYETLNIVSDETKETITMCLWINPNHQINTKLEHLVAEWVRYYKYIGADAFICCNNGMDKFRLVKNDCLFLNANKQMGFYNECLRYCKTKWMCCFDLDEFLVSDETNLRNSFKRLLLRNSKSDILYIRWRIIGHNGKDDYDAKKDIVKQYTNMTCETFKKIRLPDYNNKELTWGGNNITKWVGKTKELKKLDTLSNMHTLKTPKSFRVAEIKWDTARINHYYILSKNVLKLPYTQCKSFIGEKLINNKCELGNTKKSFRETIQMNIDKSPNCVDETLSKLIF